MRIGIVTLPLHANYGGVLQAYALQQVLKRMGHDVILLDRRRWWTFLLSKNDSYIRSWYVRRFVYRYINRLSVSHYDNLSDSNFDAIIVGSDQVWRPKYFSNIYNAFLDFTKDWSIKRIAYAVSFGTDEWEYSEEQTSACRDLIQRFDAVSVREESAINLIRKHFNVQATFVIDPTLLLRTTDYQYLIKNRRTKERGKVLCTYILDTNADKDKLVQQITQNYQINRVKKLGVPTENEKLSIRKWIRPQPPVEDFLGGIYNCDYVVTDSFHACVFSILFHKPFIVYGNAERGMSRFMSLLGLFHLESQLITCAANFISFNIENINWIEIDEILENQRKSSFLFIEESLNLK